MRVAVHLLRAVDIVRINVIGQSACAVHDVYAARAVARRFPSRTFVLIGRIARIRLVAEVVCGVNTALLHLQIEQVQNFDLLLRGEVAALLVAVRAPIPIVGARLVKWLNVLERKTLRREIFVHVQQVLYEQLIIPLG